MGIMAPVARLILKEHKRNPIVGKAAFIGRQTIPLTEAQAIEMIASEGLSINASSSITLDTDTRSAFGKNFISEETFFNLFTSLEITFIDVTDYEGASVVHDMCEPLPAHLKGKFDFVWNGSCLDNIFDAAAAQRNSCDLLASNGRIMTMEMANSHYGSYCGFAQGWFFDYYAINEFQSAEIYSCIFKLNHLWNGPFEVYTPNSESSSGDTFPLASSEDPVITLAIARRNLKSTTNKSPIQSQYRPDNKIYQNSYNRFKQQPFLLPELPSESLAQKVEGFMQVLGLSGVKGGYIRESELGLPESRLMRVCKHPIKSIRNYTTRLFRMWFGVKS